MVIGSIPDNGLGVMPGLGLNLIGVSLFRQFVISLTAKKHAGAALVAGRWLGLFQTEHLAHSGSRATTP